MDIAFMADKGGVGKSLLSYHVACRLRQLGRDVALVDLDQRTASSRWASASGSVAAYTLASGDGSVWARHQDRIWDTPAHSGSELRCSLANSCDALVIVAASDVESQVAAMELYQALVAGNSQAQIAVLVNNIMPTSRRGTELQAALVEADVPVLNTVVRRFACYEYAQLDGRAVCDWPYAKADDAWSDIKSLTSELLALKEPAHAHA